MNVESYTELIGRICREELPNETLVFELEGANLVRKQLGDEDIRRQDGAASGEFNFISETIQSLQLVSLLWGTYEIIKKVRRELSPAPSAGAPQAGLATQWEATLISAGITPEKAKEIASRFSGDLVKVIAGAG